MNRRSRSLLHLGCAATLALAAGCDAGSTPVPTAEQKAPDYAEKSVKALQDAGKTLKTPAPSSGPVTPPVPK